MACFLAPAAEAAAVTLAAKALPKQDAQAAIPFSRKVKWLSNLLWGGSALLAFEHLWHGEIVPFFPFLTAMRSPEETAVMLRELATVGGTMAAWITAVWLVMVAVADHIAKRPAPSPEV